MIVRINDDIEIARLIKERSIPAEYDLFASAQESRWRNLFCCAGIYRVRLYEGVPENITKILLLLLSLAGREKLLRTLEKRFVSFLQSYYPEWLQQREILPFQYWLYDQTKKMPVALPIPFPNALEKTQASIDSPLLLFLYQQLIKAGILDASKPLDEQIFYCLNLVAAEEIEPKMFQRQLFLDAGPIGILHHGKFSHLLQLVLIALACEIGILKLDIPIAELVPYLLSTKIEISENNQSNGWDYCLDFYNPEQFRGAFAINILMLSLIAKKQCPSFHRAWVVAYLKHFQEEQEYSPKIEERIKNILESTPRTVSNPNYAAYRANFIDQHQAVRLGMNMYQKTRRTPRFKTVESCIMQASQQPRRASLFNYWRKNKSVGERSPLLGN